MKCSVQDCENSAVSFTTGKCDYHLYAEQMGTEAAERQRELAEQLWPPKKKERVAKSRAAQSKKRSRA